jgi:hypothetical protein
MSELDSVDDHTDGSPVAALQKVLEADKTAKEPMNKHQVLGHVIKAFNAWVQREQVKKIQLRVNEEFPRFIGPQSVSEPVSEAAE